MTAHPKPPKRKRKPREGRLTGNALAALRAQCFERDGYKCQHMLKYADGTDMARCWWRITWDTGHMAHIKSRGAGGTDTLDNVVTKCAECHIGREHTKGEK